jgi:hypothetical protein
MQTRGRPPVSSRRKQRYEARPETKLFDVDIVPVNQFPHFD